MRQEFPGLSPIPEENSSVNIEEGAFNISDGMDPISVPPRITKENYAALFGNTFPEGLSPDIFESGGLELEQ